MEALKRILGKLKDAALALIKGGSGGKWYFILGLICGFMLHGILI